jgi:hypothetical protein
MENLLETYNGIQECRYKNEHYTVRDNGAVLRHIRPDKRIRKDDDQWTFGEPNDKNYLRIGKELVHRIVATAFHGSPPTPQHVVDHIDTNRHNNRPENLRWLTKLENALYNPFTRKKIEFYCGSIEVFIADPSILNQYVDKNPNFGWMRRVTPIEARNSYENIKEFSERIAKNRTSNGKGLGEWIFRPQNEPIIPEIEPDKFTKSKTTNAVQKDWQTPSEFPLCPSQIKENPLQDYLDKLKQGAVFAQNKYGKSIVESAAYNDNSNALLVLCKNPGGIKEWSLAKIFLEDDHFIHESISTFFSAEGAQKQFTIGQGLDWNGEDSIDDYC